MNGFTGKYKATIDDKGRVVLPAAFKKDMGEHALEPVVIEQNFFKECLDVYPEKLWIERETAFKDMLDSFDEDDDSLLQFFYENFKKVGMAPNGRINIPSEYISYGDLTSTVVMIGMGNYIRIWNAAAYEGLKMDRTTFMNKFREKREKLKANNEKKENDK